MKMKFWDKIRFLFTGELIIDIGEDVNTGLIQYDLYEHDNIIKYDNWMRVKDPHAGLNRTFYKDPTEIDSEGVDIE